MSSLQHSMSLIMGFLFMCRSNVNLPLIQGWQAWKKHSDSGHTQGHAEEQLAKKTKSVIYRDSWDSITTG